MSFSGEIKTISDLSKFIHAWYGVNEGTFSLAIDPAPTWMPGPLGELYKRLGLLTNKSKTFVNNAMCGPFASQDKLRAFDTLSEQHELSIKAGNHFLCFIDENQGVCGFYIEPKFESSVFCVYDHYQPLPKKHVNDEHLFSSNLTEFLIYYALRETFFFCDHVQYEDEIEGNFDHFTTLFSCLPHHNELKSNFDIYVDATGIQLGMNWADQKWLALRNTNLPPHKLESFL